MLGLITKIFGSSNDRALKSYERQIAPINALADKYKAMSDDELKDQTRIFRERLEGGESLEDIKYEAFAVVREAADRVMGTRPYDVQLIGGMVIHEGKIAEMKTGEGKTLTSTMPVYLNALSGKGVHVVTVNDYLAERDAEWMGELYRWLGLTVGCVVNSVPPDERRAAYACDITYGTNNEFGFDYLRDNMRFSLEQMVQRDFNFAIVDEVDSILIDEARTPLIISGPSESAADLYITVNKIIPSLINEDFEMDEKHKSIALSDEGMEHVEQLLGEHGLLEAGDNMYDLQNVALVHHVNQALRAHKLFTAEKDYIVKDDKVILIDEFTGRMMDGRRLSEGLHQAIEAKEGVKIQNENQTLASITFQNYFRMYPKLAGMTGTGLTEAAEFAEIYSLGVISIPTHVPIARLDHQDKIYKSLAEKEDAIVDLIAECHARKQPVLVGTVSIEKSETLSKRLKKEKIPHEVLNARHHEREAFIVGQAGRPGAVTIATNMAGRGTDIKLGGNLEMSIADELGESPDEKAIAKLKEKNAQDKKAVMDAGGLYIIGTERHESRRIDNQLRGRSGRQGDPGASMFFLSVEDDLMRIFAGDRLEALLTNAKIGLQEGEALEHPLISKMLERAQAKVESMHFDVRKNLLKFDNVMNDQRTIVYDQRKEIMGAADVEELARDMRHQVVEDTVASTIPAGSYAEQWDTASLHTETQRLLGLDLPITEWAKEEGIADQELIERITDESDKKIAAKVASASPQIWRNVEKSVVLQTLDQHWKEHLLNLDHLRQGINLRAFGQKDPLNEYKAEAFAAFELMLDTMRESITQTLSLVEINISEDEGARRMEEMQREREQEIQETRNDPAMRQEKEANNVRPLPTRSDRPFNKADPSTWGKVQRNAACPCGSGKKFKHCHGAMVQQG
ncbi:MAG: preprotein translocase subunit SecA [Micavibrio sp.]|nr:preprotein translocase subunit SecA [Micavibrio sp.]